MTYEADIRWTTHGVAHIRAGDWGGLGYGQGWAIAGDHLPTIADQIVKVRSERARFFGPGIDDGNLASDFGYRVLGVAERAASWRDAQEPHVRDLVAGYVDGYNRRLLELRTAGDLPDWCADAEWIRPLEELDLYAYLGDVALLGSGRNLAGIIGRAEAPGPDGPVPPSPMSALGGGGASEVSAGASCGWAFGGDVTASGHGIVVANPHFPWEGEAKFWECHLTIPGELDVYGVCLLGAPGVQMGFNRNVAWAHTFSRGSRFTLAKLELSPDDPTSYRYGDEVRAMSSTTHAVECLGEDGQLTSVERTLWTSHHGPMVNLPLLGWGAEMGFAYRDANAGNTRVIEQFLAMCEARDLDDMQAGFARIQGMPWVNTLASDASGRVWYIDASATPNLSDDAGKRFVERTESDFITALLYDARVALLDGSDPADDWTEVPGAREPGLVPHDRFPQLERRDVVANANDPAWVPHPTVTIDDYAPLHGVARRPLSLRTRQTMRVAARLCEAGNLTVDAVNEAILSNESLSAELLRDAVSERCRGVAGLERAVEILDGWDGRYDLDSVGAALWREFMAGFSPTEHRNSGGLFAEPFDPAHPIETPRGLAPPVAEGVDQVVDALRAAIDALDAAGVALDAPLGEIQWAQRGDVRVPVHGAGEPEGVTNVLAPLGALSSSSLVPVAPRPAPIPDRTERTGLAHGGYQVTYGTSFLMTVELTPDGPRGIGLLAYGQSGDDRSPHHLDGTEAYGAKAVRPLLFTDADIEADPELRRESLTGR